METGNDSTKTAVFAGGCFWCTEAVFEQLKGVSDVESGYIGGAAETADYKSVCSGLTGHAEAIKITYDPAEITFDQLLDVFFDAHDPTQLNRQGHDIGTQYRSAIFYDGEDELRIAQTKIESLDASGKYSRPIVTTLEKLSVFYPAEAYHQGYAMLNPDQPYIQYQTFPKVCKVRERHANLVRPE